MSENRIISFHYLFRTLILLGFSSYIVYLAKSDALQYYIAPRMMIYVKCAAVALYVIACFQGYSALRAYWGKQVTCDCEHPVSRSAFRNTIAYGLLILPLLIGFLLPNTALGSAMAAAKGMNLSAAKSSLVKQVAQNGTQNEQAAEVGSTTTIDDKTMITADTSSDTVADPSVSPSSTTNPSPKIDVGSSSKISSSGTGFTASDPNRSGSATSSAATNTTSAASTIAPGAVKTDAELQKLFHADNEWDEDFSKIGMRLYKKDTIVVKPEIYMEILSSIDLFKNNFIGKKIELSGFVYREDNMKNDQFVVGRFAVSCCSADATPYGVMVDFPTAQNYTKDMWVKVSGTIQNGSYNGNDIFTIKASNIEKIKAPESPYIYPNFEPLKELD
ncbi:TIGR03943 family protein [Paenibacillus sp. SYP-B3998]|uniref:TIGR03943 family protein n=1 Tax=Paenibacillus sp. SYP-B3998 TaxID=2678564 RepID=A0A6G3ZTU9_9BACL|nr:TIGR03943 family protein [Paenibacillus sp. SYP-B3998]NEW05490.1 TIGR03943 family protein [Paenibacillus sp. SYP-B3998]